MPMKKSTEIDINLRLHRIVDDICKGNARKFAGLVGVKVPTFHTYMKGRVPNSETLHDMCKKFDVNINWLLTGEGPRYINEEIKDERVAPKSILLLEKWLKEFSEDDPRNEIWFERELERKIPEFKEWVKKKESVFSRKIREPVD